MGACDDVQLGHLTGLLDKIRPAAEAISTPCEPASRTSSNTEFVEAVARENVRRAVEAIPERSNVLREMEAEGAIAVVGRVYDVRSGSVEFSGNDWEGAR